MQDLIVECSPDPEPDNVPVRFGRRGGRFEEIEAVFDCWPGEDQRYFRVRVRGGSEYILRQDLEAGAWRVDFFRAVDAPDCPTELPV